MPSYYDILGVDQDASLMEIKAAYRRLAHKYHPDKNPGSVEANKMFLEISSAYKTLSDPAKRQRYDDRLLYSQTFFDVGEIYQRPQPPPTNIYSKVEYSRKTYVYAGMFIAGLISVSFLFPFILMKRSADINFEKGMNYYNDGMYMSALESFSKSMNDFGGKNGIANYYSAYILFYKYRNHQLTTKYIDKALEDVEDDSIKSELYWMKGRCFQLLNRNEIALQNYQKVSRNSSSYDSALFYSGIIYSVDYSDYKKGIDVFDKLLKRNHENNEAAYFKAYSLQKIEKHSEAIAIFDDLINKNFAVGGAYFHKALSEIKINLHEQACEDFMNAIRAGNEEAQKLRLIYCN